MSALAELIDREFLAARAPRPVAYSRVHPTETTPFYKWWTVPDDMQYDLQRAEYFGATAMRFRMSDGSLVIVRRKR